MYSSEISTSDIFNSMIIDVRVQLYSNINRVINLHNDMIHPDSKIIFQLSCWWFCLKQKKSNTAIISYKNDTNVLCDSNNNINIPDFIVVDVHQDKDSSSGSSFDTEIELSERDNEENHQFHVKFYSIEEIIDNKKNCLMLQIKKYISKDNLSFKSKQK